MQIHFCLFGKNDIEKENDWIFSWIYMYSGQPKSNNYSFQQI